MAASVRLYIYSNKIVRILPLLDEQLNEEWITNKSRFSYDSLNINRINYPKFKAIGKFIVISWDFAINLFYYYLKKTIVNNKNVIASLNYYNDLQTTLSIKSFFNGFGCSNISYNLNKISWIFDYSNFFYLNHLIENIELVNFFLFISCDLRMESPLLNIRIKKNFNLNKNNELLLYSYGLSLNNSTYPIKNLGNTITKFVGFLEGKQRFSCDFFFKNFYTFKHLNVDYNYYNNPAFFLGNSIISRKDSKSFLSSFVYFLKDKFNFITFNLISSFLGFYSYSNLIGDTFINKKNIGFLYNFSDKLFNKEDSDEYFFVYQGFIKNSIYFDSDLVLPANAVYEFDSIFINLEGRYRFAKQSIKSFAGIYSDWEIINLLNIFNKKKNILKVSYFIKFYQVFKYLIKILSYYCNFFLSSNFFNSELFYHTAYNNKKLLNKKYNDSIFFSYGYSKLQNTLFNAFINNYYASDFFVKNSKTMSFCALKKYRIFKI